MRLSAQLSHNINLWVVFKEDLQESQNPNLPSCLYRNQWNNSLPGKKAWDSSTMLCQYCGALLRYNCLQQERDTTKWEVTSCTCILTLTASIRFLVSSSLGVLLKEGNFSQDLHMVWKRSKYVKSYSFLSGAMLSYDLATNICFQIRVYFLGYARTHKKLLWNSTTSLLSFV